MRSEKAYPSSSPNAEPEEVEPDMVTARCNVAATRLSMLTRVLLALVLLLQLHNVEAVKLGLSAEARDLRDLGSRLVSNGLRESWWSGSSPLYHTPTQQNQNLHSRAWTQPTEDQRMK